MPISLAWVRTALAVASTSALLAASCAKADAVMPLASHRAIYDLSLAEVLGDKAPANASGRIAYEFTGSACAGYTTDFRQVTELTPVDGATHVSDLRSNTYEDGAAKLYRFRTLSTEDGSEKTVEGAARKSGGALNIALTEPQKSTLSVGQDVAFPTEQIVKIIAAARAGLHTLPMKIFDGSGSGDKVFNTFAVIGSAAKTPPTDKAAQDEPLKSMRRWPVSVSYFDQTKEDGLPNYVLSFDLYENGVSGSLKLNYGDFVLRGEMVSFRQLPHKGC